MKQPRNERGQWISRADAKARVIRAGVKADQWARALEYAIQKFANAKTERTAARAAADIARIERLGARQVRQATFYRKQVSKSILREVPPVPPKRKRGGGYVRPPELPKPPKPPTRGGGDVVPPAEPEGYVEIEIAIDYRKRK